MPHLREWPGVVRAARGSIGCTLVTGLLFALPSGVVHAQALAPEGCALFHCTPEATGLVSQPLVQQVVTTVSNDSLGQMPTQGCSGNGTVLTCLFSSDAATGTAKGTLKMLDATTLQPIWGSAGVSGSYNLQASTASGAQVPVNFANGNIAAGDASHFVLYSSAGAVLGTIPLVGGKNKNFGLTPISDTFGVVSQQNGQLTLINMVTWTAVQTLTLVVPGTGAPVSLVSPSSGTSGVLYAIAQNAANGQGYLYSVSLDPNTNQMSVGAVFTFLGAAGASPVVAPPAITGLADNLVLLPVPGLVGDSKPQNRLLALLDSPGNGFVQDWAIEIPTPITVAPTFDQDSMSLFYHANNTPVIYQVGLLTGAPIVGYDIRTIGGYPSSFKLNSHLGGSESGSPFTLLLGGDYTSGSTGAQVVMVFQPLVSPHKFLWVEQIQAQPADYLAAWNFAPSTQAGVVCPVALAETNGKSSLVRLCDY